MRIRAGEVGFASVFGTRGAGLRTGLATYATLPGPWGEGNTVWVSRPDCKGGHPLRARRGIRNRRPGFVCVAAGISFSDIAIWINVEPVGGHVSVLRDANEFKTLLKSYCIG